MATVDTTAGFGNNRNIDVSKLKLTQTLVKLTDDYDIATGDYILFEQLGLKAVYFAWAQILSDNSHTVSSVAAIVTPPGAAAGGLSLRVAVLALDGSDPVTAEPEDGTDLSACGIVIHALGTP